MNKPDWIKIAQPFWENSKNDKAHVFDINGNEKTQRELRGQNEVWINNKDIGFYDEKSNFNRMDGPAVINKGGSCQFYFHETPYSEKDYWEIPEVKLYKLGGQQSLDILDI